MSSSPNAQKEIVRTGRETNLPFSPAVKAGGFIYVSGTLATDAQGKVASDGNIRAQTRQVLESIASVLKAAGSSLDNAVAVTVYLKQASDFAAMNEVYRTFWKKDPPTRTTVVTDLLFDGLVEMSAIAVPTGAERRVIHPADWMTSPNPYSYGIKSRDTLFLAGLIARNGKDNSFVEGDITTQTKAVLANADAILKAAGMSFSDIVSARVYLPDTSKFQAMNEAYRTAFPKNPPARATVGAGLTGPQYLIEMTFTAVQGAHEAITTPAADGTPGRPNPNLSSAIRVGNRLWVSGMLGNTVSTKGDAKAQTRETLVRIGRTLKAAGVDWPQVVEGVVYLTDLQNYAAMNEAYREVFGKDSPARATVRTGLVAADGLVEIMFAAVK